MADNEVADVLTVEDFTEAWRAMSIADRERLRRYSLRLTGNEADASDLRQEALFRALSGKRRCPKGIAVAQFLAMAMRSIADSDRKTVERRPMIELEVVDSAATHLECDGHRSTVDADISGEQECERIKRAVLALFDDDPVAQLVAEGIMEGLEGKELCEIASIDADELATIRRLIRRRVDRAFPRGWAE